MGGCVVPQSQTKNLNYRPASPLHYSKTIPITTIPPAPVNQIHYQNTSPFR